MINDLATRSPLLSNHWKYVDDITISEVICSGETSLIQNDLDYISQWVECNNMNLNPKKCKEMVIFTLRSQRDLPPLLINNLPLERVYLV